MSSHKRQNNSKALPIFQSPVKTTLNSINLGSQGKTSSGRQIKKRGEIPETLSLIEQVSHLSPFEANKILNQKKKHNQKVSAEKSANNSASRESVIKRVGSESIKKDAKELFKSSENLHQPQHFLTNLTPTKLVKQKEPTSNIKSKSISKPSKNRAKTKGIPKPLIAKVVKADKTTHVQNRAKGAKMLAISGWFNNLTNEQTSSGYDALSQEAHSQEALDIVDEEVPIHPS